MHVNKMTLTIEGLASILINAGGGERINCCI